MRLVLSIVMGLILLGLISLGCERAAPVAPTSPGSSAPPGSFASPGAPAPAGALAATGTSGPFTPSHARPARGAVGQKLELLGDGEKGRAQAKVRFAVPRVGELFAVEVDVLDPAGKPLTAVTKVTVDATMPAHGHGMMTEPQHTQVAPGRWRSEGLKLHMHGRWVIEVKVQGPQGLDDHLLLPYEQPPEAL